MIKQDDRCIYPDWPAPENVKALVTTREGGFSKSPFQYFNLAMHVGDDEALVQRNRQSLQQSLAITEPIVWLNQVHGVDVLDANDSYHNPLDPTKADAVTTTVQDRPIAVMTADCLPVFFCDTAGSRVAVAHAGWRGLLAGVIENTLLHFDSVSDVMVWLGPAIGPNSFEVGSEVREAFMATDLDADQAFVTSTKATSTKNNKYLADIYLLAKQRLKKAGVSLIFGGDFCTYSDSRFYSYRREGQTGRMASVICLS